MNTNGFPLHDAVDAGLNPDALLRLKASVQGDIDSGKIFGATMLVARGGKLAFREHLGVVAPGRPAREDDVYLAMSLSKAFTAALALRAIDQGHFTLNTRVAEILPGFGTGGKHLVTVHQLLTHSGGLYSQLMPPPPYTLADYADLDKMYQAVACAPVNFTPGERVCYTPFASHAVLARMLVEIDHQKRGFGQITREDLFAPLGMVDTRYGSAVDDPRRVGVSFTERMTTPASATTAKFLDSLAAEGSEMPAGGAYATGNDVLRFAEALRNGGSGNGYRLLSPALVEYATRNHTGDKTNDAWEFYCAERGLPKLVANFSLMGGYSRGSGHTVTGTGYTASPKAFCAIGGGSTMFMVDPERDLSVVFLSAGFLEGLAHFERLSRLNDLAIAACD